MANFCNLLEKMVRGISKRRKILTKITLVFAFVVIISLSPLGANIFIRAKEAIAEDNSTDYILISEVFYDTPGDDRSEEWVELYNSTSTAVDISHYKLGDEETRGGSEGMFQFPPGTKIEAGAKIVVALKANGFCTLYGKNPDFEISDTDPSIPDMVKYPSWSGGSFFLSNSGDEVLLLGESDVPMDVVVWEGGEYPGVVPHLGVSTGHSLERFPEDQDTDDCSFDFQDQENPNPESGGIIEDTIAPQISNLKPQENSNVNNITPLIGVEYSDDSSGIDSSTVKYFLDGEEKTSEAEVTDTSITYTPTSALAEGEHTVRVEVKDKAGNLAEAQWEFYVVRPHLSMVAKRVYWASYADYQKRELSIEFKLTNTGEGDALNTEIKDITANNGVTIVTPQPISLGTVSAGTPKTFTVKYKIPPSVSRFRTTLHASCEDEGNNVYYY